MDLPGTQLMTDETPKVERDPNRFRATVFGQLAVAREDGRRDRLNPLSFPIRGGANPIGRDPAQCQIVLEDQTLSRVHAVLQVDEDESGQPSYLIRDENSSNRSFRNGVQMRTHRSRFVPETPDAASVLPRLAPGAASTPNPRMAASRVVAESPADSPDCSGRASSLNGSSFVAPTQGVTRVKPSPNIFEQATEAMTDIHEVATQALLATSKSAGSATMALLEADTQAVGAEETDMFADDELFEVDTQESVATAPLDATLTGEEPEVAELPTQPLAGDAVGPVEADESNESDESEHLLADCEADSRGPSPPLSSPIIRPRPASTHGTGECSPAPSSDAAGPAEGWEVATQMMLEDESLKSPNTTLGSEAPESVMETTDTLADTRILEQSALSSDTTANSSALAFVADQTGLYELSKSEGAGEEPKEDQDISGGDQAQKASPPAGLLGSADAAVPNRDSVEKESGGENHDERPPANDGDRPDAGCAQEGKKQNQAVAIEQDPELELPKSDIISDAKAPSGTETGGERDVDDNVPSDALVRVPAASPALQRALGVDSDEDDDIIQSSQYSHDRTNFNAVPMELTKPNGERWSSKALLTSKRDPSPSVDDENVESDSEPLILPNTQTLVETLQMCEDSPEPVAREEEEGTETSREPTNQDQAPSANAGASNPSRTGVNGRDELNSSESDNEADDPMGGAGSREDANMEELPDLSPIKNGCKAKEETGPQEATKEILVVGAGPREQGASNGLSQVKGSILDEPNVEVRRSSRPMKRSTRLSSFVPHPAKTRQKKPKASPKDKSNAPTKTPTEAKKSIPAQTPTASPTEHRKNPPAQPPTASSTEDIKNPAAQTPTASPIEANKNPPAQPPTASPNEDKKGIPAKVKTLTARRNARKSPMLPKATPNSRSTQSEVTPHPVPENEIPATPVDPTPAKRATRRSSRSIPEPSETQSEETPSTSKARRSRAIAAPSPPSREASPEEDTSAKALMPKGKKTPTQKPNNRPSLSLSPATVPPKEKPTARSSRAKYKTNLSQDANPDTAEPTQTEWVEPDAAPSRRSTRKRVAPTPVSVSKPVPPASAIRPRATRRSNKTQSEDPPGSQDPEDNAPLAARRDSGTSKRRAAKPTKTAVVAPIPLASAPKRARARRTSPAAPPPEPASAQTIPLPRARRTRATGAKPTSSAATEAPPVEGARVERDTPSDEDASHRTVQLATSRKRPASGPIKSPPKKKRPTRELVVRTTPLKMKMIPTSDESSLDAAAPRSSKVRGRSDSSASIDSSSLRQRAPMKVMFTGYDDEKALKVVQDLGGTVTEDVKECTVLVTDKIRRTAKFLCMVAKGIPVVSPVWLAMSKEAKLFQDPWHYLLVDEEAERKWGFALQTTLRNCLHAKAPLLFGFRVFVTQNVQPSGEQLRDIVESAGGKVVKSLPKKAHEDIIVISCAKDVVEARVARGQGFRVTNNEILLTGFLRRELDFHSHQLKV
eukprot:maker-scaffold360_size197209-snap-gene-0.35 protein:Tk00940 transcript:maker-scaffold360_size197209-snap-gene-0.35-mRNA-1 annotation:"mediator of dna damage checkpoint protein 1"